MSLAERHASHHPGAAEAVLNAGAEKVSVNSPALANPDLINELSARFGAAGWIHRGQLHRPRRQPAQPRFGVDRPPRACARRR